MDMFLGGLMALANLQTILMMIVGTLAGMIFAVIPGLTFSTAMVLLVPFTFGLEPIGAVGLMMGVYAGGMCGGAFSAILLGIPGTPSAAATVFDGHKMTLKGQGDKACGMAAFSSVFGGVFSLVVLMLLAPQIAKVAVKFGAPVIFSLVILGFSCVVSLSGKELTKGLLSGFVGLFLCCIGSDPVVGSARFTFGNVNLLAGINSMPVLIGMFALPEIINVFVEGRKAGGHLDSIAPDTKNVRAPFPSLKEIWSCRKQLLYSSMLGTCLGFIPGCAGPMAPFMAYDHCKRFTPDMGTGVIQGVAAPEAANNATQGGAMIPMMALGIPCDSCSAIILAAFTIHGFAPGPLLFQNDGAFVYAVFIALVVIYLMALGLHFWGIKAVMKILAVPKVQLMSVILVLAFVGAYAIDLNFVSIVVMFLSGFVSYFMRHYGYPAMPLILGVVLGGTMEARLRAALSLTNGSLSIFAEQPLSLVFLGIALVILLLPLINRIRSYRRKEEVQT